MNIFEKIKEKLKKELKYDSGYPICSSTDYTYECAMHDAQIGAIDIINQLEKEYDNGWIFCEDRMPNKENEEILLSATWDGHNYTTTGYFLDGKFFSKSSYQMISKNKYDYLIGDFVNAWQPMPEPTKKRRY